MRILRILLIVILAFLLLINCSKFFIKKNTQLKCIVTFIDGKAFLINEENSILDKLSIGKTLNEDDIIKTDKDSTVELQFGDNSIVRIKENSILRLLKLFQDNEIKSTDLFLNIGKILVNPEQQTEGSSFEVETNSVTVGVRGTEFTVINDKEGSKVAVNKGKVIVQNKIEVKAIDEVKNISPEIAEKINSTINPEIILSEEEKIEITNDEIKNIEIDLSVKIKKIAEKLEKIKESKKEMEKIIEKIEKIELKEITENVKKTIKKEKASQEELKSQYNINEFEDIKESKEKIKNKVKKEIKKENKKAWMKYNSIFQKIHRLNKEGKKDAAIKMAEETLLKSKNEFGEKSRITSLAMLHLSILYIWETNQFNKAEKLIKDAIKIHENISDINDATICHLYKHYGELFYKKKQYNEAEKLFNKSIDLSDNRIKAGVKNKFDFYIAKVSTLKNLGNMYSDQKDYIKAEELFKQAINIIEKNDIKNNSELIYILQSYKDTLNRQNKVNEIEKINKKIISIMENDPDFKDELVRIKKEKNKRKTWEKYESLFEKVRQLSNERKIKEAVKLAENNLANAKNEVGDQSHITAHAMQNLADLYIWATNQLNEAEVLLKNAIKIYEKNDDKNDPSICHLYNQYGDIFLRKKEYANAKEFFNKSIKIYKEKLKDGANENIHFFRAKVNSLNGLANIYTEENNFIKAEELFKEAILLIEENEGEYSSELKHVLENYKHFFEKQNKKNEAEKIDKKIMLIMENNPEFKHELEERKKINKIKEAWKKYEALFKKAEKLNKEGKKDAAIKMAEDTLENAKNEVGVKSPITAHAMHDLANFYIWETNQLDKAEYLVKQAINIYQNIDDKNDSTICHLYNQYGELFYRKKEYDKASEIFNKSINLSEDRIKQGVHERIHFIRAEANALNGLANLYSDQNDFTKAEELFKQAVVLIEKNESKDSKELIYILENYTQLLKKQNKKIEAENISRRIRLLRNKNLD